MEAHNGFQALRVDGILPVTVSIVRVQFYPGYFNTWERLFKRGFLLGSILCAIQFDSGAARCQRGPELVRLFLRKIERWRDVALNSPSSRLPVPLFVILALHLQISDNMFWSSRMRRSLACACKATIPR
jgi:hypothetical protein